MNTVYWVLVAFGIVLLEARLRARNVRYLPILPAIVLGAVLSKVTYVVLQWHYAFPHWGWGAFTVLRPDTFCFFGGAVGVVLGVIISAKLTHACTGCVCSGGRAAGRHCPVRRKVSGGNRHGGL